MDTQIKDFMTNKEEWIKLITQKTRIHPLLIVLLVTLLILNVTFTALGINQYIICSQGIQRIKMGLRMAKNCFEISQSNTVMLIDSTLFTMQNGYILSLA